MNLSSRKRPAGAAGWAAREGTGEAPILKLYAAGATKEVILRLAPGFSEATGIKIVSVFDTVGALRDRLLQGEKADAALLTEAALDLLQDKGLIDADSRRSLGSVSVALAVKKGAAIPDISTPEALKSALLASTTIAYGDPRHGATAGTHFARVLDELGIRDRVEEQLTLIPFGVEVIQAVADGRIEIGISQSSEILSHPGVSLVGGLPEPYGLTTPYGAACVRGAWEKTPGFLALLQTKEGRRALAEAGFRTEPSP
jgi:molybdate transport system substrate-binding protein